MSLTTEGLDEQILFLNEWPLTRLQTMTLDEYTNLDRDTSFTYWLEKKTEHSGSVWGGSAFKFGIYKRADTMKIQEYSYRNTDGVYSWFTKYGETAEEAFQNVKKLILDIAHASVESRFGDIDQIDIGDAVKWKIAFHYNTNALVPIFKREVLSRACENKGLIDAKKKHISTLQQYIIQYKLSDETTLEYSSRLWKLFNLDNFYYVIDRFLVQAQTDNLKKEAYPKSYQGLDVKVSFGAGNVARIPWIAFLRKPNTVSNGIYPVYLYYKEVNMLILAYGVSETTDSTYRWDNEVQTIKEWYLDRYGKKPDRYGDSYIKAIYSLDEELDTDRLQNDLTDLIIEYKSLTLDVDEDDFVDGVKEVRDRRYWIIVPGEKVSKWEEFYERGIIGLDWNEIGDLNKFEERTSILNYLAEANPNGGKTQTNNSLALWQFSHEMEPGDIVIAKQGTTKYLGYGIITSNYFHVSTHSEYTHLREVNWVKRGIWEETVSPIIIKTLTDISSYPEYVDRLKRLIGIEQEAIIPNEANFWWLNFNPKRWQIRDYEVGNTLNYTTHNLKGHKRINYDDFKQMQVGDSVICFETSPVDSIVAILEVKQSIHLDEDSGEEQITLLVSTFFGIPIPLNELKQFPQLINSEIIKSQLGSIYKLTRLEYNTLIEAERSIVYQPYTYKDATKEIFIDYDSLIEIKSSLLYKKNIILQGPPGTGKTFVAKRLAYLILEEMDKSKVEMVQFHQSYSYEDFMQGFKPTEDGTFKLQNGVFYRFCKKAEKDPNNKYFFIIDEINRGNLSKIFGELMLLIESDKRSKDHAVTLTYGDSNASKFYIPANVYVIGTMNTADRSLAFVDYALRRRFSFINVNPSFSNSFRIELIDHGVDEGIIDMIQYRIEQLNQKICSDENLGPGFQIGHSYFCNFTLGSGDEVWYQSVIKMEIGPLLEEYWFDKADTVKMMMNLLLNG